jgi:site-specific DNA-adenine methylase
MTPKEKAEKMISWFDEIHIDHKKDIAYSFAHLTLEEKKYILNKSIDEILKSQNNIYGVNNKATKFYLEVKKEINNMNQQIEDKIVLRVLARFNERSQVGINKYNTTLERTDLSTLEWLTHAQEEAMDFVLYLERLKDEFKTQQTKDNK